MRFIPIRWFQRIFTLPQTVKIPVIAGEVYSAVDDDERRGDLSAGLECVLFLAAGGVEGIDRLVVRTDIDPPVGDAG